ncbi:MAG: hypothetical protein U5K37_05240 [Natrialbaceae archaeon]|nr:hypothetical protein [Natrialbaceae archaeon]
MSRKGVAEGEAVVLEPCLGRSGRESGGKRKRKRKNPRTTTRQNLENRMLPVTSKQRTTARAEREI